MLDHGRMRKRGMSTETFEEILAASCFVVGFILGWVTKWLWK